MKIAVLGAGLMGRAAVYDLARADGVDAVGVFDINPDIARQVAEKYGDGKAIPVQLDASDEAAVAAALTDYDAAVASVTYAMNPGITRAAIKAHCHLVDLGGNNEVVAEQMEMDAAAREADVLIVPDCGLAPGMVSVLAADGMSQFDNVESLKIRVGGLPQSPRPPLNYQIVFSPEGLINEYYEPCLILEDGVRKTVQPMTEVELLHFDGVGKLEAFHTSGGSSTLPFTFEKKVQTLNYKTIRYPGHCQLMKAMLDIGLGSRQPVDVDGQPVSPRKLFRAVLAKSLNFNDLDMVLVRLEFEGENEGTAKELVYEILDRQQSREALTAMMRTTAFPAAIIAWMAANGQITERGCRPQELVVPPKPFIAQLKKRNINLVIKESN